MGQSRQEPAVRLQVNKWAQMMPIKLRPPQAVCHRYSASDELKILNAAATADMDSVSSPVALSPVGSPMGAAAAAHAAAQQLGLKPPARGTKMEALDVLPPGLVQKLQGPYR